MALHFQTVTTLWTGEVLDPASLATLIPILREIETQLADRHDMIGNWLYCLRSRPLNEPEKAGEKVLQKVSKETLPGPSPLNATKRSGGSNKDDPDRRAKRGRQNIRSGRSTITSPAENHGHSFAIQFGVSSNTRLSSVERLSSIRDWVSEVT